MSPGPPEWWEEDLSFSHAQQPCGHESCEAFVDFRRGRALQAEFLGNDSPDLPGSEGSAAHQEDGRGSMVEVVHLLVVRVDDKPLRHLN